jgi:5,10-methylenetetrahydromethanopterin reductase
MLEEQTISYSGAAFTVSSAKLTFPVRSRVPLWVGSYPYSPKALGIAGELADGVVYVWTSPALLRQAAESIAAGAERAGRDPAEIDVAAYLITSIDENAARAREACRATLATYADLNHTVWQKVGFVTEEQIAPVVAALKRGGKAAAMQAFTDDLIDKIAIAGEPAYVRDRLQEYRTAGLKLPILYSVLGPEQHEALKLTAGTLRH